jgi:hypothetical protein
MHPADLVLSPLRRRCLLTERILSMLAIIAAIIFAIAFIINASGTAVSAVFDPTSLLLVGLALLALHLAGVGSGWSWRR